MSGEGAGFPASPLSDTDGNDSLHTGTDTESTYEGMARSGMEEKNLLHDRFWLVVQPLRRRRLAYIYWRLF